MTRFRVTSPDGRTFVITAPEGATKEQALAQVQAHHAQTQNAGTLPTLRNRLGALAGTALDGIVPGLAGATRGAREVVKNAIQAPLYSDVTFDPAKAYSQGREFAETRQAQMAKDHPYASGAAALGGIATGFALPAAKIAKGASLIDKAYAGMKTAGGYGALSGALTSKAEDLYGRASDAVSSGLSGAVVGGALPLVAKVASAAAAPLLRPIAQPVASHVGNLLHAAGDYLPGSLGRWATAEGAQLARDPVRAAANVALDHDLRAAINPATGRPWTPQEALAEVHARQANGVPAAPADVHESARRSFGAAARAPGPATAAVRRAIDRRQEQATARMAQSHIPEALGPTGNVEQQATALTDYAKQVSKPLYDLSDAQHIPFTQDLQELFQRPSARDALQIAGRQILDKGENPQSFGLVQGPDGVFTMGKAPTMPMYDRAKTVLDQTVYNGSKPLAAPEVTRASEGAMDIRNRLLTIMDGNGSGPHYAPSTGMTLAPHGGPIARQAPPELYPGLPKPPPFLSAPIAGSPALPHPNAFPKDPIPGNPWPVPYEAPAQKVFPESPGAPPGTDAPPGWSTPQEGLNPFWKPARDAYGGPVQARKALELGQDMAKDGGEDIANRVSDLTGTHRMFFNLGHRSGLAQDVKLAGDWGNAAARIGGSLAKREGLQAAHGPLADDLLARTQAEHEAHQTWKAVRGDSQTIDRLAEMAAQDKQIEDAGKGFVQVLTGRPGAGLGNIVSAVARGDRRASEVKGQIADVLGSTSLPDLGAAFRNMQREKARQALLQRNEGEALQRTSRFFGDLIGTNLIAPASDPNGAY